MREQEALIEWVHDIYVTRYKRLHDIGCLFVSSDPQQQQIVEDAIQDVFCAVLKKADALIDHPNIDGWLIVSLRNELRNRFRRDRTHAKMIAFSLNDDYDRDETLIVDANRNDSDLSDALIYQEHREQLQELLGERDAKLFFMYCVDKISAKKVALELGLSEINVRVRANRIRDKILKNKELFLILCLLFIK